MIDTEHEAFEKWAKDYLWHNAKDRDSYAGDLDALARQAWQASRADMMLEPANIDDNAPADDAYAKGYGDGYKARALVADKDYAYLLPGLREVREAFHKTRNCACSDCGKLRRDALAKLDAIMGGGG